MVSRSGARGVVVDQAREPAHVADAAGRRVLLEPPQGVGQLGDSAQERGLLGRTAPRARALAPRRPMRGEPDPGAERVEDFRVRRDLARALEECDLVLGLADLEAPADEPVGRRVAVGVEGDEALHVDEPLMERVDLGDPGREGAELGRFRGEELARTGMEVALGRGVDLVAPAAGPPG